MNAVASLIAINLRLSYRVKIAFFFNFIFPIAMTFAYFSIFAHGMPLLVATMMGPLISLTILTNALLLAGMRSSEMRERGMFRQFRLTPITAAEIVIADLLLGYLLFLPLLLLELAIGVFVYHVAFSGSILGVLAIASLGYITLAGLGVLVSGVVNTLQEASVVTQLCFFVLIFLSGTTMPLHDLPIVLQRFAVFTPPTLMIIALQDMIVNGAGLHQHLLETAALTVAAMTTVSIAVLIFRWEKDQRAGVRKRLYACLSLLPFLVVGVLLNDNSRLIKIIQQQAPITIRSEAPTSKPVPQRQRD